MKFSEIKFKIELDRNNIPEKILWSASDGPSKGLTEAKSINLSLWDSEKKETLRIDLWSKEMPIDEMKRFYIDTIAGLANSLKSATGDEYMAKEMEKLCDKLAEHLKKESP